MNKRSPHESIKNAGLRVTKPRLAVFAALMRATAPLSADALIASIHDTPIDRVTMYRTLDAFRRAKIVRAVDFKKGYSLFEFVDEHDHHHIVCTHCGAVEDFEGCGIEKIAQHALRSSASFSTVIDHSFELFGVCNACS